MDYCLYKKSRVIKILMLSLDRLQTDRQKKSSSNKRYAFHHDSLPGLSVCNIRYLNDLYRTGGHRGNVKETRNTVVFIGTIKLWTEFGFKVKIIYIYWTTKAVSQILYFFTPPRNRGGVIFSLQFVCVSVCLSVCVCVCVCVRLFSCEQNSSRTNAPIWTRFSLNGCL